MFQKIDPGGCEERVKGEFLLMCLSDNCPALCTEIITTFPDIYTSFKIFFKLAVVTVHVKEKCFLKSTDIHNIKGELAPILKLTF